MLKFLLEKEFKQTLRRHGTKNMFIMMPVMMILILPWAANQEIKNINLCIVNNDHSIYADRLVQKMLSSEYFHLAATAQTYNEALKSIESNSSDIIVTIEPDFEKNLIKYGHASIMTSANAVNGIKGLIGTSYLKSVFNDFTKEIRAEFIPSNGKVISPNIQLISQNRFNPWLDYKFFMIPAFIVMLLTQLEGFFPALNIVAEKEAGTIEQINVTPVNRYTFILAKLIPFWCIGFIMLTICLILAAVVYRLFPVGNILSIYTFTMLYVVVISGLGLVVSNYSETMQQAMFVIMVFIMTFNLMSGLYTPISSMPDWAQIIAKINPLTYFMQAMRMIYLKGSGLAAMGTQLIALTIMAIFFNTWAIISYKKSN